MQRELTPGEQEIVRLCECKFGEENIEQIWFLEAGEAMMTVGGENGRWIHITNYSRWLREGIMTKEQVTEML